MLIRYAGICIYSTEKWKKGNKDSWNVSDGKIFQDCSNMYVWTILGVFGDSYARLLASLDIQDISHNLHNLIVWMYSTFSNNKDNLKDTSKHTSTYHQ